MLVPAEVGDALAMVTTVITAVFRLRVQRCRNRALVNFHPYRYRAIGIADHQDTTQIGMKSRIIRRMRRIRQFYPNSRTAAWDQRKRLIVVSSHHRTDRANIAITVVTVTIASIEVKRREGRVITIIILAISKTEILKIIQGTRTTLARDRRTPIIHEDSRSQSIRRDRAIWRTLVLRIGINANLENLSIL